ncbi:MAG TPA: MoaD/ThiS family protein [Actinomycetota bacterium]|nr:MoaD/ThiS family protein [Actinomycetota bacterium]
MSIQVRIPTVLRKHTGDQATVQASGTTLAQVIDDIDARHPGFRAAVVSEDGALHRFINVYVNDEDVRFLESLQTPLKDGDTVSVLPAVAGG